MDERQPGPYLRHGADGTTQVRVIWMDRADELIATFSGDQEGEQAARECCDRLLDDWVRMRAANSEWERCYTIEARAQIATMRAEQEAERATRIFYAMLAQKRRAS